LETPRKLEKCRADKYSHADKLGALASCTGRLSLCSSAFFAHRHRRPRSKYKVSKEIAIDASVALGIEEELWECEEGRSEDNTERKLGWQSTPSELCISSIPYGRIKDWQFDYLTVDTDVDSLWNSII